MIKDIIEKYRDPEQYDLSCSETMLYAANELYDLNLDRKALRMMAPFSGGLFRESVCGALTGAYSVLGILYTNHVAHDSEELKEICDEYYTDFSKHFGTDNCARIKEGFRTEEEGCNPVVMKAFELLVDIIEKYGKPEL